MIFQNEKTAFYAIKTRSSKSRKIDIFGKGLTHGFGPKMAIFQNSYFLSNFKKENVFYDILERKNAVLRYKNKKFKEPKNWYFSKGVNPWFLSKNGHFSNSSFQAIQTRKISFTILQNYKTPFYAIKTKSPKNRKIRIFAKGLTHGFGPKMAIFPTFFFKQFRKGKCLLPYSRKKKLLFTP